MDVLVQSFGKTHKNIVVTLVTSQRTQKVVNKLTNIVVTISEEKETLKNSELMNSDTNCKVESI